VCESESPNQLKARAGVGTYSAAFNLSWYVNMHSLTAEVISIGDEMTSGARLDTNSQWLCQRLGELGVSVRFKSMVGDQLQDNVDVLQIAAQRADIIVTTGGLGPTADDLTRDAIAIACDQELVLSESALAHIAAMFERRGREMPPRNRVQAMFPRGSQEIFNPRGTAPGIDTNVVSPHGRSARIFALPGVPAEMMEMFTATVAPRITEAIGGSRRVIKHGIVKCFGLGESDMEARLGEMISRTRFPRVGITVSAATISLRIVAEAEQESACDAMIQQTKAEIFELAGDYVFGEGEAFELQHALAQTLLQRGQRLASIEVGHGAPIAGWMADVEPRNVFAGGVVIAQIDHSPEALRDRLADSGAGLSDADWVLVVDRYPSLRSDDDIVADLVVTLCGPQSSQYFQMRQRMGGHPSILHARIGKAAMAFAKSQLAH